MRFIQDHPFQAATVVSLLLERLRPAWLRGRLPTLEQRIGIVAAFARAIRPLGPANFLYSDGDALFMHAHKRFQADGGQPRPPGLHVLSRHCPGTANEMAVEGLSVASGAEQKVILAASVPLTLEPGWRALDEGELVVAQGGTIVASAAHTASVRRMVATRHATQTPALSRTEPAR